MSAPKIYPFSFQAAATLISIAIIFILLYVGHHIIFPILLAVLFAILLRPFVVFLNMKWHFPYALAVAVSVIIALLFITSVLFFVSWQIGDISNDWEKITNNVKAHFHNIQHWIKQKFNISYIEQNKYLKQAKEGSIDKGGSAVGSTLNTFSDFLMNAIIIPIYTFLILLYNDLFVGFLFKIFSKANHAKLSDILNNVKLAIHSYLTGLLTEMSIVATLTTIGYMIVGVQYALLLGVITGILNMIPYIGITIAGLLSILATLTGSADTSIVLGVIAVNIIVQFFDNNILVPLVVSSKVQINAFVSLVSILIGGAIGGVIGMFLAIPMVAILKVIFDRIDFFEPYGYVMGDNLPKVKKVPKLKLPFFNKKK